MGNNLVNVVVKALLNVEIGGSASLLLIILAELVNKPTFSEDNIFCIITLVATVVSSIILEVIVETLSSNENVFGVRVNISVTDLAAFTIVGTDVILLCDNNNMLYNRYISAVMVDAIC